MYIHIGGTYSIPDHIILGVFDIESIDALNVNNATGKFLKDQEDKMNVEWIDYEIPRSLIITLEKTYLSPVSSSTIRQRWKKIHKKY